MQPIPASPTSRLVLITGASSGIGRAAAERFQRGGDHVISVARRPCPIPGVDSLQVDLAAPEAAGTIGAQLDLLLQEEHPPRPLVLIHNAAFFARDSALSIDDDAFQHALRVNVLAPAALNRRLAARLIPGSAVLYLGSTLSEKAVAGLASYVTCKHAVIGLMRATCQDLIGTQVHTACICPGFTDTDMLRDRAAGDPAVLTSLAAFQSYGRLVQPEEIAECLWFCAQTPAINGAVLHANLGQIER